MSITKCGTAAMISIMLVGRVLLGAEIPATRPALDAERQAMRAIIPIYEQAASQGKPELLKPYLDPEFSAVLVTSDAVKSYGELESFWNDMRKLLGEGGGYSMQATVDGHATISGDMAVAHGTAADRVVMKGKTYEYPSQWTAVLRKQDGQWKLVRIHSSMAPISNPFVAAAVSGTKTVWGLGAGAAGLVLGWFLRSLKRPGKPAAA